MTPPRKPLTVAELIKRLKRLPPEWEVRTYSDPEGNACHTVGECFAVHADQAAYIFPLGRVKEQWERKGGQDGGNER